MSSGEREAPVAPSAAAIGRGLEQRLREGDAVTADLQRELAEARDRAAALAVERNQLLVALARARADLSAHQDLAQRARGIQRERDDLQRTAERASRVNRDHARRITELEAQLAEERQLRVELERDFGGLEEQIEQMTRLVELFEEHVGDLGGIGAQNVAQKSPGAVDE